ncbi:MAG TPA: hypothetical protein PLM00_08460 [Spirochaetota bacterium]|nr:hypothetical protein [Spirochaetota bacterium]HPH02742.1 hypothetical protein [Spirochaetota bacterium]HPN83412.1 hypothetical protein [Spirochaetota bacterium]
MSVRGRYGWILLTGLAMAGGLWIRVSGAFEAWFEPWGWGLALFLTGHGAGRILRSLRKDPLPLWLAILVLGALPAVLAAPDRGGLALAGAGLAWACGLGLVGFPAGFDV